MLTRLDFHQAFGTAVNRCCCQAVTGPLLTPSGKGHQKRGFLPLRDSMHYLTLALENPRQELEEHYYNPDHQHLFDLGYKLINHAEPEMRIMLQDLLKYRDRI